MTSPAPAARLDHGLLNLPLGSRGDISAQIDAFKADQAKAAASARRARNAARLAAKPVAMELVQNIDEALLGRLAARAGLSVAVMRRRLRSDAHWQPQAVIDLLGE